MQALLLFLLMELWEQGGNQRLAIIYGKQAVNNVQNVRADLRNLDKNLQDSYLQRNEDIYRKLAGLLIEQGRFPEAQAVLDLLKDGEYTQLSRTGDISDTVPYSQAEAEVIAKIENLVALERERGELQKIQKETGTLSADQLKTLAGLDSGIEAANNAFEKALTALGKAEKGTQTRVDEIKNGKELQGALTRLGAKTKSGVVALYTVLGTDETGKAGDNAGKTKFGWVIMVTPEGYKAFPINVEDLENLVFQFHNALSSDKFDPRPLAEKIYAAISGRLPTDKNAHSNRICGII